MAYFEDFSDYIYFPAASPAGTKNIGWLGEGKPFDTEAPSDEILDMLWEFCKVSVVQTRGLHECEICGLREAWKAERNGVALNLGSAEIRVFSENGDIYAAPNLIYHYVAVHHYKLPEPFRHALLTGPRPPDQAYFDRLEVADIDWSKNWVADPNHVFIMPKKIPLEETHAIIRAGIKALWRGYDEGVTKWPRSRLLPLFADLNIENMLLQNKLRELKKLGLIRLSRTDGCYLEVIRRGP